MANRTGIPGICAFSFVLFFLEELVELLSYFGLDVIGLIG